MIGLIAIIVIGILLLVGGLVFRWVYKSQRSKGKSGVVASVWGVVAAVLLSLPITWDAIPTWIAFKYYAQKEAGLTVFKTLEQWKTENPGVAETLEPYRNTVKDRRMESFKLDNGKSRTRLNDRFAYDAQSEDLFLSVALTRHEISDTKTGEVMFKFVAVASGNSGGLASGGAGWWKPWLIARSSTESDMVSFHKYYDSIHSLGAK